MRALDSAYTYCSTIRNNMADFMNLEQRKCLRPSEVSYSDAVEGGKGNFGDKLLN